MTAPMRTNFVSAPNTRLISPTKNSVASPSIKHCENCPNEKIHDPVARPSKKINSIRGDGDVWEERLCQNVKTGHYATYFYSKVTGRRVRDEPPTGAGKVVYLGSFPVRCAACQEILSQ